MVEVALFSINDISLVFSGFLAIVFACLVLIGMRALVVSLWKNSKRFSYIQAENRIAPEPSPEEPQQQLVEKLTNFMEHSKPYLEPHITVERLALKLNVSPKFLSCTINSKMHMNFFELIGTYRVAEAKKRLADSELRQKPISEIMKSCGFNSKSVFNQAFKKTVGVTPSHYRQQHLH
ncbi:MAG TPA: helix-turn-helix transcriptional regulator [Cellvibrio sp.]|nr:helix-turn-helix transcriptional regulator [Cellvibrio sp.]